MNRAKLTIPAAFLDSLMFNQGEARIIGMGTFEPFRGTVEFIIEGEGLPPANTDGSPQNVIAVISSPKVQFHSIN